MFSSAHPHAELQPIQAIQSSDTFAIDEPPLTPEQHPDPQVAKPRPSMRQIANAEPEGRLILRAAPSVPGGSTKLRQAAGPRTAHLKRPVKPLGQFPAAGGP
jgi:hypothetical protein